MNNTAVLGKKASVIERSGESGLDAEGFKQAFRRHPAGVALITASDETGPVALTASSVISVSAEPAVLVYSVSDRSSAASVLREADTVVVHMLGADEIELAQLGARPGANRFEDTSKWARLDTGEPYFVDASVWIRGRILETVRVGESTLIIVHALESFCADADAAAPLVYHNRKWYALGENSELG